jgi:hypothetical protein
MLGGECQTSFTSDSAACCMPWQAAGQAHASDATAAAPTKIQTKKKKRQKQ